MARILILGAGALARETILAIPQVVQTHDETVTVVVASRDAARAAWLARLAAARSFTTGAPLKVESATLDWANEDGLAATLATVAPTVILNTASLQSAWSLDTRNAWNDLVRASGYGVTAALQAALVPRLGRAIRDAGLSAKVVNGCYPDLVNAGGRWMGLRIECGIGNVALLGELFRQELSVSPRDQLRLIAGHWDVTQFCSPPNSRTDYPLTWINDRRVAIEEVAHVVPMSGDISMNSLSAGSSAALLYALATDGDWVGHVPGPLGEMGGYPVKVIGGSVQIDLPQDIGLPDARSWCLHRSELDGATMETTGHIYFSPRATEAVRRFSSDLAGGFHYSEVEAAAKAFVELRRELTQRTPGECRVYA